MLNLFFYMRFSTSGGELDILHLQHCQFDISHPNPCIKIRFYGLITSFALFFGDRHGQLGLKDQKYGIIDNKLNIKSSLHLCPVISNS